ncbi:MAG: ATP-grasp domain-containing protein [Methylovulum sp.]|nr:ATP-grasp domain-containing protein [Methylovulum sp.]
MTKEPNQKVLVLDGNELSTLSIVRSLGRKNLNVTVASERNSGEPIAGYSKYAKDVFLYANPLANQQEFVAELIDYIKCNSFDLLIPVTDKTVIPLAKHKQEIEQYTLLATPGLLTLEQVSDKNNTFALAASLDVPIPKSINISHIAELEDIQKQLSYPIVIKPSRSVAGTAGDVRTQLSVQYAFSEQELVKKCSQILPYTVIVLQEYFIGDGVGVEILAAQGEIIYAFQHKRHHELPLTGGGSCLRESVAINPQLLAYSKRLIKAIDWHGVAMVEFKHCEKTGESRLIEINGRFWGSLPLAVNAGADFPYYLYQLLVLDTKTQALPAAIGVQSRKLKEDLYWFLIVMLRKENSPLVIWPTALQLWRDFISAFSPRHHIDSMAYDDLKPGMIDLCRTVKWLFGMVYEPLNSRLQKVLFNGRKKTGIVKKSLSTAKHVLFLCYGNINRSSLAEQCLHAYLAQQGKNIGVSSAGFHPKEKRPADPVMVGLAKQQGIDLSQWSSRLLTEEMLAEADIVFAMEIKHYQTLSDKFPKHRHKVHLLGTVTDNSQIIPLEISDPYGQPTEIYQRCFQQVDAACKIIADLLA